MEFSEKLQACLRVETLCEEIYYSLCGLFPEAGELFRQLAEEEERHADILTICTGFHDIGALPEVVVPDSAPHIQKSVEVAEGLKRTIQEETLSLGAALEKALELEESVAEIYFNELMAGESDAEVVSHLQRYYKNEMSHTEKIRRFIQENGL
jgi:rubrerythrin